MLSEKPWTLEAIVRMLLGIFICLCLGSVVVSGFHYAGRTGREQLAFFAMMAAAVVLLIGAAIATPAANAVGHAAAVCLALSGSRRASGKAEAGAVQHRPAVHRCLARPHVWRLDEVRNAPQRDGNLVANLLWPSRGWAFVTG